MSRICLLVILNVVTKMDRYLNFKFSPCSLCSMFSFGYFPGVWGLNADVSEPSIGSIFLGFNLSKSWKPLLHQYNTAIPPAQHSFIPPPPSTTCRASTRPVRSLYFLLVLPLPRHIPSDYKYTDTSQPELFFLNLPRKMEPIEGSETSAFKPQTPGKYPKENILQINTYHQYIILVVFFCLYGVWL